MSRRVDRYAEKIQEDIVSCPNEQSYEDGEVVCWITGSPISVMDLLMEHNVPNRLWDEVVSRLRCPECDTPIEIWQEVGTKPQLEISHEQRIEKALKRNNERLSEFTGFLKNFPYLGALHPTGKRIVKEIEGLTETTLKNKCWFRARRVDSPTPMTIDDLRPPDPQRHSIPEGRFNHFGQACWYLADDPKVAAAEATSSAERLTWVQEWKIEEVSKVLDLRARHAEDDQAYDHEGHPIHFPLLPVALVFGDHLSAKPERESAWRPEYFVPRFVADAARRAGFSGMLFRSTRSYGENLVLFDPRTPLIPVATPKLVCLDEKEAERRDGLFLYQGFAISVADIPDLGMP